MISSQRQEIPRLLGTLSALTPDVRFGQLIANLSYRAIRPTNEAIWGMEDEQLLTALREHITALSDLQGVSRPIGSKGQVVDA